MDNTRSIRVQLIIHSKKSAATIARMLNECVINSFHDECWKYLSFTQHNSIPSIKRSEISKHTYIHSDKVWTLGKLLIKCYHGQRTTKKNKSSPA